MKHLISISDLTKDRAIALLDNAQELSAVNEREVKKVPALRGKTVVNLFFENSTRTRISFELAAKRLSADVINFTASTSSLSKGESLKDTAQTLEALGAHAIVVRHPASGAAHALAHRGWISSSIINAGDGSHEHPTQALLDALTLRQAFGKTGDLAGLKVLIVGDISHSRVARSNLILLKELGATVAICGPATLVPASLSPTGGIHYSLDDAIDEFGPDAVLMLRIQSERMEASFFPTEREYSRIWGMNAQRLARLQDSSILLHPGPMNRGLEIDAASADSTKSRILEQVENGVAIRMAVLFQLLSGEKGGAE